MTCIEPNPHTVLLILFKKSEFINVNVVLAENYCILSQGFGGGFCFVCVCFVFRCYCSNGVQTVRCVSADTVNKGEVQTDISHCDILQSRNARYIFQILQTILLELYAYLPVYSILF